ncbi:UNVERIFIED_CONTAM: hypothetical protein N8J90_15060 [Halobacillus marinus]
MNVVFLIHYRMQLLKVVKHESLTEEEGELFNKTMGIVLAVRGSYEKLLY